MVFVVAFVVVAVAAVAFLVFVVSLSCVFTLTYLRLSLHNLIRFQSHFLQAGVGCGSLERPKRGSFCFKGRGRISRIIVELFLI